MPNKKGFTLIELLIVISLIAMLTGILIQVIDVQQLMKRAKDAVVKGTIIKLALVVESNVSSTGHVPINEGCNCDIPNSCEMMTLLNNQVVNCHKTQITPDGTKLWMEVKTLKMGETLLGGNIDLDDSDAIRYMDFRDGCLAAVSEETPPWVYVWSRSRGLMFCHPGTDVHPGLVTCNNILNDSFVAQRCESID
ncbi:MAG: type II secretion system protein [Patescibacteria group bacterium]